MRTALALRAGALVAAAWGLVNVLRWALVAWRYPRVARVRIVDGERSTTVDEEGAVRSVQAAELTLPAGALDMVWSPMHLERLARTYWRFLARATLGIVHVDYAPGERAIVALTRPLVLLRFDEPEYELDAERGWARWRIRDGLLVAPRGVRSGGFLEIEVARRPAPEPGLAIWRVEVEVANFYPAIASAFSMPVYMATQTRVHVLVTHAFLRSLARLDLARSRVRRLEAPGRPA